MTVPTCLRVCGGCSPHYLQGSFLALQGPVPHFVGDNTNAALVSPGVERPSAWETALTRAADRLAAFDGEDDC